MFEYSAALHIHSNYSDGSGAIPEIAKFASEVGLDVLLFTDHNTLAPMRDGYEKWHHNVLTLIGSELNDADNRNHYLAFDLKELPWSETSKAIDYVSGTENAGGLGFIAHPFEKRNHMKEHPAYPWTDWEIKNYTGIEIWNHMSEWMEGLTEQNKYQRFVHPLKSVQSPVIEALKLWDKVALERPVVGVAGVDAHAHKHNILGFFEVEIFPYKVLFKSLRTHILCTGELIKKNNPDILEYNKKVVYDAFRFGRVFFGNYSICDFRGFRFFAEDGNNIYQMGETIPSSVNQIRLRVTLPNMLAKIKLIKNGELIDTRIEQETMWSISNKGVYRIEVELDGNPWIYSNHIRYL